MLPEHLGGYRILDKIGAGGMGEVYRARDTALDRDVAIKVLPAAFAGDADRVMRFEREAKTLAALNHPHIGQIYGLVRVPGDESAQALVMEYVDGEDLSERIARGPVPVDDALGIAAQIAEALEAAHDAGITHRDLKPANIKLRPDGVVKVLDFGLAKPSASGTLASGSMEMMLSPTMTSPALTMQGIILGTAVYMSPEQAKGKPVDRRTDIWAFGCVLYELLTGRRAFRGDDVSDTMVSILRDEPAWQTLPPNTPPRVRRLLRQCLAKDPRKRLPHIGVARLVLLSDEEEPAVSTPVAPGRAWYSRLPWAVAGAAVVALAAVPLWPRPSPRVPVRFTIEAPSGGAFTGSLRVPRFAVSPDGSAVVYQVTMPDDTSRLLLRRFDALESRPLKGTESNASGVRGQQAFWSPDGKEVGFFDEDSGALLKLHLESGEIRTITRMTGNQYGGTWGRGDVILFSTLETGGIRRVAAAGGDAVQVTRVDPADPAEQHLWPEMLPDGRRFLFLRVKSVAGAPRRIEAGVGTIMIGSLDGTPPRRLLDSPVMAKFAPPDRLLFVRDHSLFAQRLDADRAELIAQPELVVNDVHYTVAGRLAVSASHTGVLVYSAGGAGQTSGEGIWVDREGKPVDGGPPLKNVVAIRLSPDGRRLGFVRATAEGMGALWIRDLARGVDTRLGLVSDIRAIAFTRDGDRVAFVGTPEEGLAWQPVSGGAKPQSLVPRSPGQLLIPHDWTADGQLVYASAIRDPGLFLLRPPGGAGAAPRALVGGAASLGAVVSPDGRWIAITRARGAQAQVFLHRFPVTGDERWVVSGPGGAYPRWRRDGRELYFLDAERRLHAVSIRTEPALEIGVPRMLFQTGSAVTDPASSPYDVAPDGQRFVITRRLDDEAPPSLVVTIGWMH